MLPKNKNILFIGPHLDDIEIGAGMYLNALKESSLNNTVKIICCSRGALHHRINHPDQYNLRLETKKKNFSGVEEITYEADIDINFKEAAFDLNYFIENAAGMLFPDGIDIIIGPSSDMHQDHRVIKEIVDVLARPDQGIERYLMYVIPGSESFDTLYGGYQPHLSKYFYSFDNFKPKKKMLDGYVQAGVMPANGIRSVKGIKKACSYWGAIANRKKYSELFNIGFISEVE